MPRISAEKSLAMLFEIISANIADTGPATEKIRLVVKYDLLDDVIYVKNKISEIFLELLKNNSNLSFSELKRILKCFAKLRIDLNGLKPVNDIGGHDLGDTYLDRVASVLKSKPILDFLDHFKITLLLVARAGGDEFDMLLHRKKPLDEKSSYEISGEMSYGKITDLLRDLFISEITSLPFSEFDFNDPTIQKGLGPYIRKLLKKSKKETGEDFAFTPSAAVGVCLFWEAIPSSSKLLEALEKYPSPERMSRYLMGRVQDLTDSDVSRVKQMTRETLLASESPTDQLDGLLMTRTPEARDTFILKEKLKSGLRKLETSETPKQEVIASMQKLLETDERLIFKKAS